MFFLESVAKEIREVSLNVHSDPSPSIRSVQRWIAKFKCSRISAKGVKDVQQGNQQQQKYRMC